MRAVALPGLGDTAQMWAPLLQRFTDTPLLEVEWPGVWAGRSGDDPLEQVLRAPLVRDAHAVVAHGEGCVAGFGVMRDGAPRWAVLTAPALGASLEPDEITAWQQRGSRSVLREHPRTRQLVELEVPFSYAASLLLREVRVPAVLPPMLVVLMSADTHSNDRTRALLDGHEAQSLQVAEVAGPHRWWEHAGAARQVCERIKAFVKTQQD